MRLMTDALGGLLGLLIDDFCGNRRQGDISRLFFIQGRLKEFGRILQSEFEGPGAQGTIPREGTSAWRTAVLARWTDSIA